MKIKINNNELKCQQQRLNLYCKLIWSHDSKFEACFANCPPHGINYGVAKRDYIISQSFRA